MSDYAAVASHRTMALDARRNAAYTRALARVITPESVVLDLGAGTGVLGLIAARLGARRVYLVEPEDVVAVAEEVASANGLRDRVTCIRSRIEDAALPERVTVIVSVLTGNFLVTEDLLPALFWARDHLLEPGGVLVPGAASMIAAPVCAPQVHGKFVESWSAVQGGVDVSAVRSYAANAVYFDREGLAAAECLATPTVVQALDFHRDGYEGVHASISCEATQTGLCHGWAGWTEIDLGGERLSTSPFEPAVHWSPAYLPLDPPIPVVRGDRLELALHRTPHGDWSWMTRTPTTKQQHSTLLGVPFAADTLARASLAHRPQLTAEGCALRTVLRAFDGTVSVEQVARTLHQSDAARWPMADAVAFVQRAVRKFT